MGRDPLHDYRKRCIYHITIGKDAACPVFSFVSGSSQSPLVTRSSVGEIIERNIRNFPNLCPSLQILQYVIMSDHIHFAIFVRDYMPRSLGSYIGIMKVKTGQEVRKLYPNVAKVFADDFHDRYLRPAHDLNTILNYIRENPKRLLIRRENPNFFSRLNNIDINGSSWQAYGNLQLLQNPFKAPVIVHRADSTQLKEAKLRRWKHLSENGGVLVSPFISSQEKEVRRQCESVNGKIILISNSPLAEREKPSSHNYYLCSSGRLLILAPLNSLPDARETFVYLNSIAESICMRSLFSGV